MNISELIKKHLSKVVKEQEEHISQDGTYMVLSNLVKIKNDIETILSFKHQSDFPKLVTGEHAWAGDHITTSADDIEEVANFLENEVKETGSGKIPESTTNEAMVQVAGKGKPSGAKVLAMEIMKYFDELSILPNRIDKKNLETGIAQIIMDSTF